VEESHYLSYVLRLWQVKRADRASWRASLENSISGDRLGFADLEALFTYLEWVTQDPSCETASPEEREAT
jgi:hypothetical protein